MHHTRHPNRSLPRPRGTRLASRQSGFTLIELMVVVAVIGLLAGIAIVTFGGEQKKSAAKSEVTPMFAEMRLKQEQFRLEQGSFTSTNSGNSESVTWPLAPAPNGGKQALLPYPGGSNWAALGIAPELNAVRCAYVMVIGDGGDDSTVGAIADGTFGFVAPPDDWYYVLATCDMDGDSSTVSYYFQQSGDAELYYDNEGQ